MVTIQKGKGRGQVKTWQGFYIFGFIIFLRVVLFNWGKVAPCGCRSFNLIYYNYIKFTIIALFFPFIINGRVQQ